MSDELVRIENASWPDVSARHSAMTVLNLQPTRACGRSNPFMTSTFGNSDPAKSVAQHIWLLLGFHCTTVGEECFLDGCVGTVRSIRLSIKDGLCVRPRFDRRASTFTDRLLQLWTLKFLVPGDCDRQAKRNRTQHFPDGGRAQLRSPRVKDWLVQLAFAHVRVVVWLLIDRRLCTSECCVLEVCRGARGDGS